MGNYLYCFIVGRVLLDILYILDEVGELLIYIYFDDKNIDIYIFFYIAEGVVISKLSFFGIYFIASLFSITQPFKHHEFIKFYCFVITMINFLIMNAGIVTNSSFPIVGVPIAGMFVIIFSLASQNKYQEEIKKLSPLTNPLNQNQFGYPTTNGYINNNPAGTALYPSSDDMMNQKPVTNVYNPNEINNIYPTAEDTKIDKPSDNNECIPPPAYDN